MRDYNEIRKEKELPPLYTDTLMSALDYSRTDLEANKQGYLTQNQRKRLQDELKEEADGMWLILTVALGVTLLLAFVFMAQGMGMMPLVIGAGLFILPLMWVAYRRQNNLKQDDTEPEIKQAIGDLQILSMGRMGADVDHWLIVGDKRFHISREAYGQLVEYDAAYGAVYYVSRSNTFLSAEIRQAIYDAKNKDDDDDKLKNEDLIVTEEDEYTVYDDDNPDQKEINNRRA